MLDEIQRVSSHDSVAMARRLATVRSLAGLGLCPLGGESAGSTPGRLPSQHAATVACRLAGGGQHGRRSSGSRAARQGWKAGDLQGTPLTACHGCPSAHPPPLCCFATHPCAGGGPAVRHQQRRGGGGSNPVRRPRRVVARCPPSPQPASSPPLPPARPLTHPPPGALPPLPQRRAAPREQGEADMRGAALVRRAVLVHRAL